MKTIYYVFLFLLAATLIFGYVKDEEANKSKAEIKKLRAELEKSKVFSSDLKKELELCFQEAMRIKSEIKK